MAGSFATLEVGDPHDTMQSLSEHFAPLLARRSNIGRALTRLLTGDGIRLSRTPTERSSPSA
jgi:hypothetical protein